MACRTILFRADASHGIGHGHVMRCLSLAGGLRSQGDRCLFVCQELAGNAIPLIEKAGFQAIPLSANATTALNAHDEFHCIARVLGMKNKADWLIADHYSIDDKWESASRTIANRIMVIDDLANRSHSCDLLLDQNLGRELTDYRKLVGKRTKLLIGPQYALLRPEFPQHRRDSICRRKHSRLHRILVNMGGTDPGNLTASVLCALEKANLSPQLEVSAILGPSSPWASASRALVHKLNLTIKLFVGVDSMATHMSESDLAIGASGSTSWERCCLGLPSIIVVLADNQREIAQALHESKAAVLIDSENLSIELANFFSKQKADGLLLSKMSDIAQQITDGLGVSRVLKHLN
jgi:UDP-2,4-diacetamido-2,4,6-trideoxy-beta-L-altropyranose hydrolase